MKVQNEIRTAILLLTALFASTAAAQDFRTARVARQVLVSIPDRKLAVLEGGKVIRTFPAAVGASVSPSPSGEFKVVNRIAKPTYYHPGVVIPAGAGNPIGTRWLGLNRKGYGIHGTNEPRSIGKAASHGCIRLRNREVVEFFRLVNVGDVVKIRAERDEEIARVFGGAEHSTTQVAMNGPQPMGAG